MVVAPNYRRLIVWQKAHKNAISIIGLVDKVKFVYSTIVSQCIAAATSVGANIAEGNAAQKSKKRYFEIALNSAYEFDNWIQILKDSDGVCGDKSKLSEIEKENIEVIKILSALISSLRS